MYIQNEDELALRNNEVEENALARRARRGDSDDEGGEGGGDDSDSGDDEDVPTTVFAGAGNTAAGAGSVKVGKTKMNPNLAANQPKNIKLKDLKSLGNALPQVDDTQGMNRREREAVEEKRKKEEYMRRHLAGETVEAKKEIAMLAEVKARREAAAANRAITGRAAHFEVKDSDEESSGSDSDSDSDSDEDLRAKKANGAKSGKKSKEPLRVDLGTMTKEVAEKKRAKAAAPSAGAGDDDNDVGDKLSPMEVKKMNPKALKEALKVRGLDIQGQKGDLIKRLAEYEAAR